MVLDASIALAALHEDETSPARQAWMMRVAQEGAWVPAIWHLEVGSVLLKYWRRGRYPREALDRYFANLEAMRLQVDPETSDQAWTHTRALAEKHGLTLYDASYLELAIRIRQPLATLDIDLQKAALAESVPLVTA